MDLDCPRTTLADHPGASSRLPGPPTRSAEQSIHQHLAKAEYLIHQQRPAQALALLQAPGIPPATRPLLWHPRWYLLVGWALLQRSQPQEASVVLEQGLAALKLLLRRCGATRQAVLREWGEWLRYFLGVSFGPMISQSRRSSAIRRG